MPRKPIEAHEFAKVYPLYLQKLERKGRTRAELDSVIRWLTGSDQPALDRWRTSSGDFAAFFRRSPLLNPHRGKITGLICGHRVEDIEDPVVKFVRQLDKLVDELARGKALDKVLRS